MHAETKKNDHHFVFVSSLYGQFNKETKAKTKMWKQTIPIWAKQ